MKIYSNGKMLEVSGGGGGQAQDIYDDQERMIGSWFGKPLYRRTYQCKTPAAGSESTVFSLEPDVYVVRLFGFFIEIYNGIEKHFNIGGATFSSAGPVGVSMQQVGSAIRGWSSQASFSAKDAFVTLEYTKTTDQATFELPADERAAVPDVPMMGVSVSGDIAQAPDILDLVEEV